MYFAQEGGICFFAAPCVLVGRSLMLHAKRIPTADVNNKHGTESNAENVHSLTLHFNFYNFIFRCPVKTALS
jgi:hypothetical protein